MATHGRHRAALRRRRRTRAGRVAFTGVLATAVTLAVVGARACVAPALIATERPLATPSVPPVEPVPSPHQTVVGGTVFDLLPPKATVADRGSGSFDVVSPSGPLVAGPDVAVHYTVEIERGLPFLPAATARTVDDTLTDPRGWTARLGTTFGRVSQDADVRVLIATPGTTDALCAPLETRGRVSCRNGDLVVLNARRWADGIPDYRGVLDEYRRYVVNHEVGHAIGQSHVECPAPGAPAPVMQQQTYGLDGCARNAWPTVA